MDSAKVRVRQLKRRSTSPLDCAASSPVGLPNCFPVKYSEISKNSNFDELAKLIDFSDQSDTDDSSPPDSGKSNTSLSGLGCTNKSL